MKKTITVAFKPVFSKENNNQIFLGLRETTKEIVQQLQPKRKNVILIKAILFPLIYIGTYISATVWAKDPWFFMGVISSWV